MVVGARRLHMCVFAFVCRRGLGSSQEKSTRVTPKAPVKTEEGSDWDVSSNDEADESGSGSEGPAARGFDAKLVARICLICGRSSKAFCMTSTL